MNTAGQLDVIFELDVNLMIQVTRTFPGDVRALSEMFVLLLCPIYQEANYR